ncbi:MAG: MscL family protein [Clostridia bacterium]|nr:MscL family protein [Clostridia bacterium]
MNNYINEFKKFINRGNVVDMAVGIIVGSSFTAVVNTLSNNVLKPIVNYLLALVLNADSAQELYTFLKVVRADVLNEAGEVIGQKIDLTKSIYIDWGALINAIVSFFLIACVLFTIVKIINRIREEHKDFTEKLAKQTLSRDDRRELKKRGINPANKAAVREFLAEKARIAEEKKAKEAAEAEEKARLEREQNPTTEDLLKKILAVISKEG